MPAGLESKGDVLAPKPTPLYSHSSDTWKLLEAKRSWGPLIFGLAMISSGQFEALSKEMVGRVGGNFPRLPEGTLTWVNAENTEVETQEGLFSVLLLYGKNFHERTLTDFMSFFTPSLLKFHKDDIKSTCKKIKIGKYIETERCVVA